MKKFRNILWGLVLILIGFVIGGNSLGITNINLFFDGWWTLFIIVPCFIGLFKENEKMGNVIGLIIGIALLLACRDIIDFDIIAKLWFPVLLVCIGSSIIFKDTIGGKVNDQIRRLNESKTSQNEYCATFSGQDLKFDDEKFTGADLTAVFGGIECDLRKAIIQSDIVINTSSIFGGIDIFVPENVKIKVKSSSIFGGVSNKKKTNQNTEAHTVYINATCLFGGVDIK
ncbi:MAG: hypothetical protein IJE68_06045 [Clostridia bacterium]|nr:hypothetical protein [Clostridia bacterium]